MTNPNEARRRASSKALIVAALKAAGPRGCSNDELNAIAFRYGGRIHEARKDGHDIESIHEHDGSWRFVLHEPARTAAPRPGEPGYLRSLPVVASITGRPVRLPTDSEPTAIGDRLF